MQTNPQPSPSPLPFISQPQPSVPQLIQELHNQHNLIAQLQNQIQQMQLNAASHPMEPIATSESTPRVSDHRSLYRLLNKLSTFHVFLHIT